MMDENKQKEIAQNSLNSPINEIQLNFRKFEKIAENIYSRLLAVLLTLFILSGITRSISGQVFYAFIFYITLVVIVNSFHVSQKKYKFVYFSLALLSFLLDIIIASKSALFINSFLLLLNLLIKNFFLNLSIYLIIKKIFSDREVTQDTIKGCICVYILIHIVFSIFYKTLYNLEPKAFAINVDSLFDANYFSIVTLTTLGYGDIIPVGDFARTLVSLESIIGVMYPSIIIARLVGLYSSKK
jgi:voltage-gated potassium channel Kch